MIRNVKLQAAIKKFEKATATLREAEVALNQQVEPLLNSCETLSEIMDLVDLMPKGYAAVRRMYEKCLRIEANK